MTRGLDNLLGALFQGVDLEARQKRTDMTKAMSAAIEIAMTKLVDKGYEPIDIMMCLSSVSARHLGDMAAAIAAAGGNHDLYCTASLSMGVLLEFHQTLYQASLNFSEMYKQQDDLKRATSPEVDEDGSEYVKVNTPVPEGVQVVGTGFNIYVDTKNATAPMLTFSHINGRENLPSGKLSMWVPAGNNKLRLECCSGCVDQGFPVKDIRGLELRFFDFRSREAIKEYNTTGLCQTCQDLGPPKGERHEKPIAPQV